MPTDSAPDSTDLPCPDVLAGATMALMSQWAATPPRTVDSERSPDLRRLMARKIVSNLFFLMHHPLAKPAFRQVMAQVHAHWQALLDAAAPAPATARDTAFDDRQASTAPRSTPTSACAAEMAPRPTLH